MELVVETCGLTGGYGTRMVLRDLSLRVARGSIYGFFGPNGAGKTTAFRMLRGIWGDAWKTFDARYGVTTVIAADRPLSLPA